MKRTPPPVKIEKFTGEHKDLKKYALWRGTVIATMEQEESSDVGRATRLYELLDGRAKRLVTGLMDNINETTCDQIWQVLETNYGGKMRAKLARQNAVMALERYKKFGEDEVIDLYTTLNDYIPSIVDDPAAWQVEFIINRHVMELLPTSSCLEYLAYIEDRDMVENIFSFMQWLNRKRGHHKTLNELNLNAKYKKEQDSKAKTLMSDSQKRYARNDEDSQEESHASENEQEEDETPQCETYYEKPKQGQNRFAQKKFAQRKWFNSKPKEVTADPRPKAIEHKPSETGARRKTDTPTCIFCKKGPHPLEKCFDFQKENVKEKAKFVAKNKLCFHCLKPGHTYVKCTERPGEKCGEKGCDKPHHKVLHGPPEVLHCEDLILYALVGDSDEIGRASCRERV